MFEPFIKRTLLKERLTVTECICNIPIVISGLFRPLGPGVAPHGVHPAAARRRGHPRRQLRRPLRRTCGHRRRPPLLPLPTHLQVRDDKNPIVIVVIVCYNIKSTIDQK